MVLGNDDHKEDRAGPSSRLRTRLVCAAIQLRGACHTAGVGLPSWLRRLFGAPPRLSAPTVPPGTSALAGLLDALEEVAEQHAEVFDTDVREQIWEVVEQRYVRRTRGYVIPATLGMFTDEGNARLRAALEHHLKNLVAIADAFRLDTEVQRLRTIRNPAVASGRKRYSFEDFFGAP